MYIILTGFQSKGLIILYYIENFALEIYTMFVCLMQGRQQPMRTPALLAHT